MSTPEPTVRSPGLGIEANGINVIDESERKGTPAQLFWPWCASNVSVLAVSYGSFVLGFGLSLGQALVAAVVGAVLSFLLVGLVSIAGKRGSAPTLVLSRAAFGRYGNALPGVVSYLLLVGWETVLVVAGDLRDRHRVRPARLGRRQPHQGGRLPGGRRGHRGRRHPRLRRHHAAAEVADVAMIAVTLVYIVLTLDHVDLGAAAACRPAGPARVVGAHDPGDDRLRRRLGELRRRLLALPAPHRLDAAAWSSGRPSAAACRW